MPSLGRCTAGIKRIAVSAANGFAVLRCDPDSLDGLVTTMPWTIAPIEGSPHELGAVRYSLGSRFHSPSDASTGVIRRRGRAYPR